MADGHTDYAVHTLMRTAGVLLDVQGYLAGADNDLSAAAHNDLTTADLSDLHPEDDLALAYTAVLAASDSDITRAL
jgi:hypothetical protein